MRRKHLCIALGLLVLFAILIYGFFIEPARLTVTNIAIHDGRLADILAGRKVAFLSDLHFAASGEPDAAAALRRLEEIRPDLIVLTGDYVKWGSRGPAYERALDFLARLRAPLGVFAVLGDSDRTFSRKSCEFCHRPGSGAPTGRHPVVFLKDEQRLVTTPLGAFLIMGVSEYPAGISRRLRRLPDDGAPVLLLSHTSQIFKHISSGREVLVLCGDTHGGQVRLPAWFWRLISLKPDPDHLHGLFREGRKVLVVTSGLGTSLAHFRVGVPPEIVVLEFKR